VEPERDICSSNADAIRTEFAAFYFKNRVKKT
jgi:hypothetical protein